MGKAWHPPGHQTATLISYVSFPRGGLFLGGGYPLGQLSGEEFLSKDFLSPSVPTAPGPLISVPVSFFRALPSAEPPFKGQGAL